MSSPVRRAVGVALVATALQLLMIVAFSWPAVRTAPRDVPIVAAGPGAAAVAERLDRERPGAFEITAVADEAAAREALAGFDAYGAIVTTPGGPRVLVASAASPVVAQQLAQLAQGLSGTPAAAVEDVVAADPDDPRGAGFGALALPLIMSGIAAAVVMTLAIPRPGAQAVSVLAFAVLGGLGAAWLAQGWLAVLPGPYLAVASVMGLAVLAVTGTVAGAAAVLGRAGIALGSLTFLLLGNPLSAAASAPEMLPQPWGDLGRLLPPGAAATLLRSVAFFDGAGAAGPLTVLLAWAAAGLALLALGGLRSRGAGVPAAGREQAMAS
ncbi:membrane protein [Actinomadura viridis]|uniref:ABC transporter permease n=1 Tax=Actinomadura viridis TaxID=58110 RepID=A0A931DF03_9ACTN|nr:hypothetical protein [Actinomadura viridis]MBG6087997.1 hypothetical protein [Actinomadura viridis]